MAFKSAFDVSSSFATFWCVNFDELQGHFALPTLPTVPGNVVLHKGWFDKTLPAFLDTFNDTVALLHVDVDLYSSTKTVLTLLTPYLMPGTFIVFDELVGYAGYERHEVLAFYEFLLSTGLEFEVLGRILPAQAATSVCPTVDMGPSSQSVVTRLLPVVRLFVLAALAVRNFEGTGTGTGSTGRAGVQACRFSQCTCNWLKGVN
jgi:hypothetical protein